MHTEQVEQTESVQDEAPDLEVAECILGRGECPDSRPPKKDHFRDLVYYVHRTPLTGDDCREVIGDISEMLMEQFGNMTSVRAEFCAVALVVMASQWGVDEWQSCLVQADKFVQEMRRATESAESEVA